MEKPTEKNLQKLAEYELPHGQFPRTRHWFGGQASCDSIWNSSVLGDVVMNESDEIVSQAEENTLGRGTVFPSF